MERFCTGMIQHQEYQNEEALYELYLKWLFCVKDPFRQVSSKTEPLFLSDW